MDNLERELSQTSSLNDNVIAEMQPPPLPPNKKIRRNRKSNYSLMKVTARNFLINVSCNWVKVEDFDSKSLVDNCYAFLLLYLHPFYLKRKFDLPLDRNYVKTLWYLVIPSNFYMFICRPDNYVRLNKIKLRFQDTIEITRCFMFDSNAFQQLRDVIKTHACIFQNVYANLLPRYFARIDDYGIQCRLEFDNVYKAYLGQKTYLSCAAQFDQPEIKTEPAEDNENEKNEEKDEVKIIEPPKT